jgi:hydrogenase maturation protease
MRPEFNRDYSRIAVIGIGNVLLGDDAFGPLVVEKIRCLFECFPAVEILDLGTPGLDIAPYMYDTDLVVIVDAVNAEEEPGSLCVYCEAELFSRHAQLRLTAHDPGVQESLVQLKLAGHAPKELIIVGVVPASCVLGQEMSPAVLRATSAAIDLVARLLVERNIDCRRRLAPVQPNLWWLSGARSELPASA